MKSKTGHDVVEYASRNHVDPSDELLKVPTLENEQSQSDKSQLKKSKDHSTEQLDKQKVSGPFKKIAKIARQKLKLLSKIDRTKKDEGTPRREEWHRQKQTGKWKPQVVKSTASNDTLENEDGQCNAMQYSYTGSQLYEIQYEPRHQFPSRQPPSGYANLYGDAIERDLLNVYPVTHNSFPRFMVTHPRGYTTHTLDKPFTRYTISDLLTDTSSDESFSEEEESDVYWGPGWYY
jgi:hypothetical protein